MNSDHAVMHYVLYLYSFIGSKVDIYVLGEGIQYDHAEFGGRAFDGGFSLESGQCSRANFGTIVASLAAGSTVGVAKKANVYRYSIKSL